MAKNVFEGLKQKISGIQKNVLLKNYTTYKIGGPAKYFVIVKNKKDLITVIDFAKKLKIPIFILGGGSNLLVSDKGFNGLVIKIDISEIKFKGNKAIVGAGIGLSELAFASAKKGLSGIEWGAGIPLATIGGAVYGHAQAFGDRISDSIERVEVLDKRTLKIKNFSKTQCCFSLKNSIFKKNKNLIIISIVLKFKKDNIEKIKNKIKENLQYRKNKHPLNFPSAGSTFVNPEKRIKNKKLLAKLPELVEYNKKGIIPAGYLISKCDLAGKKVGRACFSKKHANFIINLGGAKAKDVLYLIKLARSRVKKTFGIDLETEVQLVGF